MDIEIYTHPHLKLPKYAYTRSSLYVCVCVCVSDLLLNLTSITHCTHVHRYTHNFSNTHKHKHTVVIGFWWRHWVVHSMLFVFGSFLIAPPLFGFIPRFGVLGMCFKFLACWLYYLLIGFPATRPRPLPRAIAPSFCCSSYVLFIFHGYH
jgi:hypothetical protein